MKRFEKMILAVGASRWLGALFLLQLLQGCGQPVEVAPQQFAQVDELVGQILINIAADETVELVTDIDHARLGAEAGSPMAPTRVVLFSDPELEAELFALNPLTALEMPLRILVYAPADVGEAQIIFNSFDYLSFRYGLEAEETAELRIRYESDMTRTLTGTPDAALASFPTDRMTDDAIISIASPFDFEETLTRVKAAIDAQDDTMHFGTISLAAVEGHPGAELILFGAPGPGASAMKSNQTLGLDGFCQKFLVWENDSGEVFLSFNDLVALTRRQGGSVSLPLRVIDFRLNSTFEKALSP